MRSWCVGGSVWFVFTDTPRDTEHALFLYPLYPMTMLHAPCWVLVTVRYVNPPRANAARLRLGAARSSTLQLRVTCSCDAPSVS